MSPYTSKPTPRRRYRLLAAVTALSGSLLLTGCTPEITDEPYFATLTSAMTAHSDFTQAGEPGRSCGGNTPACVSPVFTVQYNAPANLTAHAACTTLTAVAFTTGNPAAYASVGANAGNLPAFAPEITAQEFCEAGLTESMPNTDGTVFYQGTVLLDVGLADQIGKHFSLGRNPDGTYVLTVDFSRNVDTLWWDIQDGTPAHLTLEQVLQNNANLEIQIQAQDFANTMIGKPEKAALAAIKKAGYISQVFQRDDTEVPATGYNPKRILLNIQNGVVQDAMTG